MCGIIGATAQRDVAPILIEGLTRMEYRGYDSSGLAVVDKEGHLHHIREAGKVASLKAKLIHTWPHGHTGIAHTRWATHGVASNANAHPHVSRKRIALVHNGIIENYISLREKLQLAGYQFESETDSEVLAHAIHQRVCMGQELSIAVRGILKEVIGSYAIAVMDTHDPDHLVAVCDGAPLLVGLGIEEFFVASDAAALAPVTHRMIHLHDGDLAILSAHSLSIYDRYDRLCERDIYELDHTSQAYEKGNHRHFMHKEIFEQPDALRRTLQNILPHDDDYGITLDPAVHALLARARCVHLVACGSSFHAVSVARYWIESIARIPAVAETASEYRYRQPVVPEDTLFICVSQSGETADTIAAQNMAHQYPYIGNLAICNVKESAIVRAASAFILTHAGPEIGVASTKAFTAQLTILLALTLVMAQHSTVDKNTLMPWLSSLRMLPTKIEEILSLEPEIIKLAETLADKSHALYLGRGVEYPVAIEGALKLKEVSYIHAEAYAAGELKHGPLALVGEDMPVIVLAMNNSLVWKTLSNLNEIGCRGGDLIVIADAKVPLPENLGIRALILPPVPAPISAMLSVVPLQLLAYHVAVMKGTDVDQPRNLAKAVTVE